MKKSNKNIAPEWGPSNLCCKNTYNLHHLQFISASPRIPRIPAIPQIPAKRRSGPLLGASLPHARWPGWRELTLTPSNYLMNNVLFVFLYQRHPLRIPFWTMPSVLINAFMSDQCSILGTYMYYCRRHIVVHYQYYALYAQWHDHCTISWQCVFFWTTSSCLYTVLVSALLSEQCLIVWSNSFCLSNAHHSMPRAPAALITRTVTHWRCNVSYISFAEQCLLAWCLCSCSETMSCTLEMYVCWTYPTMICLSTIMTTNVVPLC